MSSDSIHLDPDIFSKRRNHYRPDGKANWTALLIAFCGCLAVSGVVATALAFLLYAGFYFVVLIPVLAALGCASAMWYAVELSHCRNTLLAGLLGAVVCLAAYVGSYHVSMLWLTGFEHAHRVDALPTYIAMRWGSDTVEDASDLHTDDAPAGFEEQAPSRLRFWGNALLFLFEASVVAGIGVEISRRAAARPYCPEHQEWLVGKKSPVRSNPRAAGERQTIQFQLANRGAEELTLHHCCNAMASHDRCPIYLSASQQATTSAAQAKRDQVISNVRLELEEEREFASLLPTDRLSYDPLPTDPLFAADADPQINSVHPSGLRTASVTPVAATFRGHITSPSQRLIGNSIFYTPILMAAAAMAFLCGPVALKQLGWADLSSWWSTIGLLMLPLTYFSCLHLSIVPYQRMDRIARETYPTRGNSIVDFSNPDLAFALLIPRHEIQASVLGEWDCVLIEADAERSEVRIEGDLDQYRIPAASVTGFEIERAVYCTSQKSTSYEYLVRIEFQTESGLVERLFSQRHKWKAMSEDAVRRKAAEQLAEYLQSAIQRPNSFNSDSDLIFSAQT